LKTMFHGPSDFSPKTEMIVAHYVQTKVVIIKINSYR
jgi:hypothetical protein